jgi:type IV secretory pathway TrbF-like protein
MPRDQDGGNERIQTKGYAGRQRWFQDMEQLVLERRDRLGRMVQRDGRLIVTILVMSLLLSGAVLGNILQGLLGVRTEVQVLLLDHLGNERPLIRLTDLPATPEQLQILEVLGAWIRAVRLISKDGRVMNASWDWLHDFTSQTLLTRLEGYKKDQMQRQQTGVSVYITKPSLQRLSTSRSYYVEWDECTVSPEGRLLLEQSAAWKATVTVADFQSKAVQDARALRLKNKIYRNLLGIVVDDVVDWKPQPFLTIQIAEPRCAKS